MRKFKQQIFRIIFFINFLIICEVAIAQPGILDPTFNTIDFGHGNGANNEIETTCIQSDGKIIIGGRFTTFNETSINRIARLNIDGSIDSTFNPGAGANNNVFASCIQSDGKIIIGGDFYNYNGSGKSYLIRLNSDGSMDQTFMTGTGANGGIRAISIQSDGKIIIGGNFTAYNGISKCRIARINSNGSLDLTFNPGTGFDDWVLTSSIQNDGKIIICGNFTAFNGTGANHIARLNTDGTRDGMFNIGTGTNSNIRSVCIQNDGKILIAGEFTNFNGAIKKYIARLNINGSLDASFNNNGSGANSHVYTISIQNDGKIIIGGLFTSYNDTINKFLIRLNSDGSMDSQFSPCIEVSPRIMTTSIQNDGKIIFAGDFIYFNGIAKNRIARLNEDGFVDTLFNPGTGVSNNVYASKIQDDGKIIIGGSFTAYNGKVRNRLARLNCDGSLDSTFLNGKGAAGGLFGTSVITLEIQDDGKIIIGGDFSSYNGIFRRGIARVNANGSIDSTFNPGTGANGIIRSVSIQNDGKILISGDFTNFNNSARRYIARLNDNGSLDSIFDLLSGPNTPIYTVNKLNNGKIIIGGAFTSYNGISVNRIARLNSDGTVDSTFHTGSGANGEVRTTVIQNDGKIIIGGLFTSYNDTIRNRIARLNMDGSLDNSFDPGTGANSTVNISSVQVDGKIVIGGIFTTYNGLLMNNIARLYSNGAIDVTFNLGTGTNGPVYSCNFQDDGKIIIGGDFTSYNGVNKNRLVRLSGICEFSTISSLDYTSCGSYTLNNQTYLSSGIYTQILVNSAGCDSLIILNLIVNSTSDTTINQNACGSYSLNGQTYTTSGMYIQTFVNTLGCDSLVILNLSISNATTSILSQSACNSFNLNGQTYVSSGIYTQVLMNAAGCDSVLTLQLTIDSSSTSSLNRVICGPFTLNDQTYTTSGIYYQITTNSNGCDSIITLDLILIQPISVDLGPDDTLCWNTGNIVVLDAGNSSSNFLWNDSSTIQTLTINTGALQNGTYLYSVTVTDTTGVCFSSDTIKITLEICEKVSLNENLYMYFYPNPTHDVLYVEKVKNGIISIYNLMGEILQEISSIDEKIKINLINYNPGSYFLKAVVGNKITIKKIIIN